MNKSTSLLVPRPGILEITPYQGGRSEIDGHNNVIRLASNESALGPSPKAVTAFIEHSKELKRYPDGNATALRHAIAQLHKINPRNIACGAGSDEILQLLTQAYAGAGDEVLYSRHGFLVYELAAKSVGARPVSAPEKNFTADVDSLLSKVTKKTRIIFLANPNNPTGSYISKEELFRLWSGLPGNVLLVLDAAYAEFVLREDYDSGLELVQSASNVIMTRTFSKVYGLASLRLGWCYGSEEVIDVINRLRGPFNVTGPALAGGLEAIRDQDHISVAIRHNTKWMSRLTRECNALGIEMLPSVCNFALLRLNQGTGKNSKALDTYLSSRGILTRNVDNYHLPDCLRISVGLDHEMETLLAALKKFMA